MKTEVYQVITDRIIEQLEKGCIPWHKPWNAAEGMPKNLISKKEYRGINVFMLSSMGYGSPYWLSFKQVKESGGTVNKGEKGCPVVYWNWIKKEDSETGKVRNIPFLRYYTVFNVQQTTGLDTRIPKTEEKVNPFSAIDSAEQIITNCTILPPVVPGGNRAFYSPSRDVIGIPNRESFDKPEEYYSTFFHEAVHSTGHKSRLDRTTVTDNHFFGSTEYSKEELIAEMGAAFLCGITGILDTTFDNSAAYIQGWLSKLRKDPKIVVWAAASAQKASDTILGKKSYEEKEVTT